MKKIPLTKGYEAIVDDDDYDFLMQWKWHILEKGSIYAMRNSINLGDGKRHHILMHRVINETQKGFETDHINGEGLDNRKSNLRAVTKSENQRNRRPNKNCSSKYKGVSWHKQHQKWYATIQINKKRIFLGLFEDELEASFVYNKREKKEIKKIERKINVRND